MSTGIVSDLHLGTRSNTDLLRRPHLRELLLEQLAGLEQVVLLGDVVDLRHAPVAEALAAARPFLRDLAGAVAGARVVLVPGNHDHQLVAPWLERRRLAGERESLGIENEVDVGASELTRALAADLEGCQVAVSYPGLWVREDVYATHGHYLDCHSTVPSLERLAVSVTERLIGGLAPAPRTPDHYEAPLAPLYAASHHLAQTPRPAQRIGRPGASVAVRGRLLGGGLIGQAMGAVGLPAAVAGLNRSGLGPFRADLSAAELGRAALTAMGEVVAGLGIEAAHVVFGHTHRPGPVPGEGGWTGPGGVRLTNSGNWVFQRELLGRSGAESPWWPGTLVRVGESGSPRVVRLLDHLGQADLAQAA